MIWEREWERTDISSSHMLSVAEKTSKNGKITQQREFSTVQDHGCTDLQWLFGQHQCVGRTSRSDFQALHPVLITKTSFLCWWQKPVGLTPYYVGFLWVLLPVPSCGFNFASAVENFAQNLKRVQTFLEKKKFFRHERKAGALATREKIYIIKSQSEGENTFKGYGFCRQRNTWL